MSLPATTLPTPLQPDTAAALARLADGMDGSALLWASGYLAGMAHALAPAAPIAAPVVAAQPATIVYGSQTGNAKRAAEALLAKLQAANLPVRLLRADAYPLRELADETLLYVVVSTQGDGDPPDDARGFLEFVEGRRAPALKKLKFAVLAPGRFQLPAVLRDRPHAWTSACRRWVASASPSARMPTSTSKPSPRHGPRLSPASPRTC
jgi:sulfite reductase (NADPH) flavoprotein alpha-component